MDKRTMLMFELADALQSMMRATRSQADWDQANAALARVRAYVTLQSASTQPDIALQLREIAAQGHGKSTRVREALRSRLLGIAKSIEG
jgi:hypothetical protein